MGSKVCLILGVLLLSHVLIPTEATARAILQTAEELKSDVDAGTIAHKPLQPDKPSSPGHSGGGSHLGRPCQQRHCSGSNGKPYERRGCRSKYNCRGRGPPGHV